MANSLSDAGQSQLRVAIGQLSVGSEDQDAHANLERHLEAVAVADETSADLIVFPELSLSGYRVADPTSWSTRHLETAVAALREVAGDATIVVGAPVAQTGGGATNAALVITTDGVVHQQHKLYLPNYSRYTEGDRFIAGAALDLIDVAGFRIGIIICEDTWHPSLAYFARLKGADMLIHPAASAEGAIGADFSSADGWATITRAEALYHAVYVIFANLAGSDDSGVFWGGSTILSPTGSPIVSASTEPAVISTECDRAQLNGARKTLPMTDLEDLALATTLFAEAREARASELPIQEGVS